MYYWDCYLCYYNLEYTIQLGLLLRIQQLSLYNISKQKLQFLIQILNHMLEMQDFKKQFSVNNSKRQ